MAEKKKNLKGVLGQLKYESNGSDEKSSAGVLSNRNSTLSNLVSGSTTTVFQQKIDPARCRLWGGNGRDYSQLSEKACRDLIDSLLAQGRQEIPAIVRKVDGDPDHEFELIVGFRRHWSVSWLRAHDYPDFQFLVEVRDLSDEAAFRLADIENRARSDISDFERAQSYLDALKEHYENNQSRMAKRLEVSTSWLSRYLTLARLPNEVVHAFPSIDDLNFKVARDLAPLLKSPVSRKSVVTGAKKILKARADGQEFSGPETLRALKTAGRNGQVKRPKEIKAASPVDIKTTTQTLTIRLDKQATLDQKEVLKVIAEALVKANVATWQ